MKIAPSGLSIPALLIPLADSFGPSGFHAEEDPADAFVHDRTESVLHLFLDAPSGTAIDLDEPPTQIAISLQRNAWEIWRQPSTDLEEFREAIPTPESGARVSLSLSAGLGSLSDPAVMTDESGRATSTYSADGGTGGIHLNAALSASSAAGQLSSGETRDLTLSVRYDTWVVMTRSDGDLGSENYINFPAEDAGGDAGSERIFSRSETIASITNLSADGSAEPAVNESPAITGKVGQEINAFTDYDGKDPDEAHTNRGALEVYRKTNNVFPVQDTILSTGIRERMLKAMRLLDSRVNHRARVGYSNPPMVSSDVYNGSSPAYCPVKKAYIDVEFIKFGANTATRGDDSVEILFKANPHAASIRKAVADSMRDEILHDLRNHQTNQ